MKCERLVCVVTYNRKSFVDFWLRAWNNADKQGAKLAVLHSYDGSHPDEEEKQNILKHNPDFYVPFHNTKLRDMEAFLLVIGNKAGLHDWDYLFWFTDDMLPMRRSFLKPFVEKIKEPGVGLVAQCYEPRTMNGGGGHIRTVAYAINRDVGNRLVFPSVGREEDRPYMFEHGRPGVYEDHIRNQVRSMGYEFKLCHSSPESSNYQHWTSFLDWMWDCHLLASWKDMWKVYKAQFETVQPWDEISSRKDSLFSRKEFEERSLLKGKVCAVIPTSTAPINYLMWSLFSLLLRSNPDSLEHVIVGINGPDERTGDPSLQDKKQKFVEGLRRLKWFGRDMPVTLTRTWSRVGHAQMLDQCSPWIHTEFYLAMHDDIIITDRNWHSELEDFRSDKSLAIKASNPILGHPTWSSEGRLELAHLDTSFSICRKSAMFDSGALWAGYYLPLDFHIGNLSNFDEFSKFQHENGIISDGSVWPPPMKNKRYSVFSADIGGIAIYELLSKGYFIDGMRKNRCVHFRGKSWDGSFPSEDQINVARELEMDLESHREYMELYLEHSSC